MVAVERDTQKRMLYCTIHENEWRGGGGGASKSSSNSPDWPAPGAAPVAPSPSALAGGPTAASNRPGWPRCGQGTARGTVGSAPSGRPAAGRGWGEGAAGGSKDNIRVVKTCRKGRLWRVVEVRTGACIVGTNPLCNASVCTYQQGEDARSENISEGPAAKGDGGAHAHQGSEGWKLGSSKNSSGRRAVCLSRG